MFNINAAALPALRTRQALLILDLQNEFVSPHGALTIKQPDVIVSRVVQLAKAFRISGAGDVIWIRTQFDGHRPLSGGAEGGDQIITTDAPVLPRRTNSSRGRPPISGRHEQAVMEADEEAFLSYPAGCEKAQCVRPGSDGAQLAATVLQATDPGRDITFTKTHYSAFAAGQQLVQLLRGRFVTEIYVCGALTNISIYATALDAGRHGYDITLVDDCCGYRSDMRHSNAVHQLMQLTGCEVTTSADVMAKLKPEKPSSEDKAKRRSRALERAPASGRASNGEAAGRSGSRSKESAVGRPSPEDEDDLSRALPLSFEKLSLSGELSSAPAVSSITRAQPQPQPRRRGSNPTAQQTIPSRVDSNKLQLSPGTTQATSTASLGHQAIHVNSAFIDVDSNPPSEAESPGSDTFERTAQLDVPQNLSFIRGGQIRYPTSGPPVAGSAARSAVDKAITRSRMTRKAGSSTTGATDSKDIETSQAEPDEQQPLTTSTPTVSEPLCEGDTTIITNLLPPSLAASAFDRLKSEVAWQRMSHQGGEVPRLVAVQGEVDAEGNMPVYRHPSDESPPLLPFTPTVAEIRTEVEKQVGHPVNHVLIQFYRDSSDFISEHSDKTLDIVRGSFIANVSLGAQRTMVFRTKRADKDPSRKTTTGAEPDKTGSEPPPSLAPRRITERAVLPHNSLCRMGPATNMRWLHAIRADKRLDRDKTAAELCHGGARISLTFRRIGTFLDHATQSLIWGQGAVAKTRAEARPVVNGQTAEAAGMLRAFGAENHAAEFEWEGYYGAGFDVLHLSASPRLYASKDRVVNMAVAMVLAEFGVGYARGSTGAEGTGREAQIRFVDNDAARSAVEGGMAVMLYLDAVYGGEKRNEKEVSREELGRRLTRFQRAAALLDRWRAVLESSEGEDSPSSRGALKELGKEMEVWDGYAREVGDAYIAGGERPSLADFALWPVLHDIVVARPGITQRCKHLLAYYSRLKTGKAAVRVLGGEAKDEAATSTAGPDK